MNGRVDPEVSRRLGTQLTYRGGLRTITARLAHGDRLVFELETFGVVGSLPLRDLFWQAMRQNPAGRKHPLQPGTLKGAKPGKRGRKPDTHYAREYGVSTGTIRLWRGAGAPLSDPDRMGDFIFTIKLRRGRPRKERMAA